MFDSPLSASAYDVLGVDPTADEETLRRAYRVKLRETHPDTGGDAARFVQVQRAWELVATAAARAAYDRGHGFGDTPAPSFSPDAPAWRPPRASTDTRPRARSFGVRARNNATFTARMAASVANTTAGSGRPSIDHACSL